MNVLIGDWRKCGRPLRTATHARTTITKHFAIFIRFIQFDCQVCSVDSHSKTIWFEMGTGAFFFRFRFFTEPNQRKCGLMSCNESVSVFDNTNSFESIWFGYIFFCDANYRRNIGIFRNIRDDPPPPLFLCPSAFFHSTQSLRGCHLQTSASLTILLYRNKFEFITPIWRRYMFRIRITRTMN